MTGQSTPDIQPEPRRYFFVHLQKTAGTALFQRLRSNFGQRSVYPTPDVQGDVRATMDVNYLVSWFGRHRDEVRVVTGHFPLCTTELLSVPFTTFTVLRHPVERTLSLLRRRRNAEERFHGRELEEIYADDALRDIMMNHMVKMLSLGRDELTSSPLVAHVELDRDRLETAKRNLRDRIDLFGLQEHFDEFCNEVADRFGWDLGEPRFANRTESVPVRDELRERIAEDNRLDVELYEFGARLWASRRAEVVNRG